LKKPLETPAAFFVPGPRHPACETVVRRVSSAGTMEPCPHLPAPDGDAHPAARLGAFRHGGRGGDFYLQALRCAQSRWQAGLPGQALLMLNRAMGARLDAVADADVLAAWPIPYRAVLWLLRHGEAAGFLGNPRRHFQHLATRMSGGEVDRRVARAWACWALARRANPAWPADEAQIAGEGVREPMLGEVEAALARHGLPGERDEWRRAMGD
jgi:hypothetical protein